MVKYSSLSSEQFPHYNFLMRKLSDFTKFILASTLLLLTLGCAKNQVKETATDRGPASVSKPLLWGKDITPGNEEFLDELENAPAQKYN